MFAALVQGLIEKHGQSYFLASAGVVDPSKVARVQEMARMLVTGL